MLALVFGDSLSMSYRNVGVEIEDTYAYILQRYLESKHDNVYVKTVNLTGTDIGAVLEQANGWLLPNLREIGISILQFGIVDCAPRVLPKILRIALSALPAKIQTPITKFLHDNRSYIQCGKHPFRMTHTKKFEKCYKGLLNRLSLQSKLVIVLGITQGQDILYRRSRGLERSIGEYNQIIKRLASQYDNVRYVSLVDKFEKDTELYLTNDLHITKEAHFVIAQEIMKLL